MATLDNYHVSTYGVFKQVRLSFIPYILGKPNYISQSGSKYWYRGSKIYRYSNHWGNVSSCIWEIKGKINAPKKYKLGVIELKKLERIIYTSTYDLFASYMEFRSREIFDKIKSHAVKEVNVVNKKIKVTFLKSTDGSKYVKIIANTYGLCEGQTDGFWYKEKNSLLVENFARKYAKEMDLALLAHIESYPIHFHVDFELQLPKNIFKYHDLYL